MADRQLHTLKNAASHTGIAYMSLYKIMNGEQKPTVEQCILVCQNGGFSANWLFLGIGEMRLKEQISLNAIEVQLKELKTLLKNC